MLKTINGTRFFQMRNSGLQNQDVLFISEDYDGVWELLLDPNTLSQDGTIALTNWKVSKDGRMLAYAVSASGSDWLTWRIRDVANSEDLPDVVEWSKFLDAAWLPDGTGFFYARYDEPKVGKTYADLNLNQKLYLHRFGQLQAEDQLIYQCPDHKELRY